MFHVAVFNAYKVKIFIKVIDLGVRTKFIQPSIEILNLRIDEPVTTLTDILLAVICVYAFVSLLKVEAAAKSKRYFSLYFLLLGTGALTGGILGHAFQYRLAEEWKLISWTMTLVSVALMVQALLNISGALIRKGLSRMISMLNISLFLLALILTIRSVDFNPVKYYSIVALVLMSGSICYYIHKQTGNRGVLYVMGGVGVGFMSAIIFSLQLGLSHWFNHRDVSHIILSVSVFFVYKGVVMTLKSVNVSLQ
jgi:hypothetical protein